jgi:hypothetical protein
MAPALEHCALFFLPNILWLMENHTAIILYVVPVRKKPRAVVAWLSPACRALRAVVSIPTVCAYILRYVNRTRPGRTWLPSLYSLISVWDWRGWTFILSNTTLSTLRIFYSWLLFVMENCMIRILLFWTLCQHHCVNYVALYCLLSFCSYGLHSLCVFCTGTDGAAIGVWSSCAVTLCYVTLFYGDGLNCN